MTRGIILLTKNGFEIFAEGFPAAQKFTFVPEVVQHLDVINKEQLFDRILVFIDTNKISHGFFSIVLTQEVLFIKDFLNPPTVAPVPVPSTKPPVSSASSPTAAPTVAGTPTSASLTAAKEASETQEKFAQPFTPIAVVKTAEEQAKKYIDIVPFEVVNSKVLPIPNGVRVYAVNAELYLIIKRAFEKKGSTIEAVTPLPLIDPAMNVSAGLSASLVTQFLQKTDVIKKNTFSLPLSQVQVAKAREEAGNPLKKTDSKSNIIAVVAFIMILIVLSGVVYKLAFVAPPAPPVITNKAPTSPVATPLPTTPPLPAQVVQSSSSAQPVPSLKSGSPSAVPLVTKPHPGVTVIPVQK